MKGCYLVALAIFLACLPLAAQLYVFPIQKTPSPIQLDGILDDPAWLEAAVVGNFYQNFPFDTSFSPLRSEVRATFDGQFLYIGATIYQKRASYIVSSLKRDFNRGESDEFQVNIDPFNDKLNGFHFAVSPLNVQREGLIDNGSNLNASWDNKWYSRVHNTDDYWSVEMAIPFKTLRYKVSPGDNRWRINFVRIALQENEISTWVAVPRQFDAITLAFAGELQWAEPPPKPGMNVSVIPYLTGGLERDYELQLPGEQRANAGFDAKIALTPSLNLDLTFNPDFSQVEVDRQITNLSRFELFFPERRQFFLENQDLFSMFGFPNSRPFFSRRIGLVNALVKKTTTTGQEIETFRTLNVPILAGARLSGKISPLWRVGLLNMTTAGIRDIELNPANYSVGVVQRQIFDRSTIGAIFVNKENFIEQAGGGYRIDGQGYNRVAGLEYNLYSKDNKWEAEVFYHRSFSNGDNTDAQAAAVFLGRYTRHWQLHWGSQYIGSRYRADMGFVPRRGYLSSSPSVNYNIFPKTDKIIRIQFWQSNNFIFHKPDYQLTDRRHSAGIQLEFPGQSSLWADVNTEFIHLFFAFDPTNSGGLQLPAGSEYTFNRAAMGFQSDQRKKLFINARVSVGQYFNGSRANGEGAVFYRLQPYGVFALTFDYNDIRLPEPYNSASFWLLGPRAELAFSRDVFFSAFLQYNTQADNVNLNCRFQWRFRPVSDLFLVYTDNYFTEGFFYEPMTKNRALVMKISYWLNL